MTFDSISVSTTECNRLTIYFKLTPAYEGYKDANFSKMYAVNSLSKLIYTGEFSYSEGLVGYNFQYIGDIVGTEVKFVFTPRLLGLS